MTAGEPMTFKAEWILRPEPLDAEAVVARASAGVALIRRVREMYRQEVDGVVGLRVGVSDGMSIVVGPSTPSDGIATAFQPGIWSKSRLRNTTGNNRGYYGSACSAETEI